VKEKKAIYPIRRIDRFLCINNKDMKNYRLTKKRISTMALPKAVNKGPTVLKVLIFNPIMPSNNCTPIIIAANATKNDSSIKKNRPMATKSNERLLDIAYLALIKASPGFFRALLNASTEKPKLTAALMKEKAAQR